MNVTYAPTMFGSAAVPMPTQRLADDVLQVQVKMGDGFDDTLHLLVHGGSAELDALATFCALVTTLSLPLTPEEDVPVTDDMIDARHLTARDCMERLVESGLFSVEEAAVIGPMWLSDGWSSRSIVKMAQMMVTTAHKGDPEEELYA